MTTSAPTVYRGFCVDNKDPQKLGRIRVQVPQILGAMASGWAFPSWGMEDLEIWPEDRLPKPGQGVWVMFESDDKMIWMSVFEKPTESAQIYDDDPRMYEVSMGWLLPCMPEGIQVSIAGTLWSLSGRPQPIPVVVLQKSLDRITWQDAGGAESHVDEDGTWSFEYTRQAGENNYWYRGWFAGTDPFSDAQTPEEQIPDPPENAAITWNDFTADWQKPHVITGTLLSDGRPIRQRIVSVYTRATGGSNWSRQASGTTNSAGQWKIDWFWAKSLTLPMDMKAVFLGDKTYDYAQSTVKAIEAPIVPTYITWNFPTGVSYNQTATISGTLMTEKYGVPEPDAIQFEIQEPSITGVFVSQLVVPVSVLGKWTFQWKFVRPDATYRMHFPLASVYQDGVSQSETRKISLSTYVSTPAFPVLYMGSSVTASGIVRDSYDTPATAGQVELWYRKTTGPDTAWTRSASAGTQSIAANGTYTLTHPSVAFVGPTEWKVRFLGGGGGFYDPADSAVVPVTIGVQTPVLSKGAAGYYSMAFSWSAVPGATKYQIYKKVGASTAWSFVEQNETSHNATGLGSSTDYSFKVRAVGAAADGALVFSGDSAIIKGNTGVPESRNINSFDITMGCYSSKTWRPLDGWVTFFGDQVIQGAFGSSGNQQGVMGYDGGWFQNYVNGYGAGVINNLNFSYAAIYMQRADAGGSSAGAQMTWYVTSAWPGQGGGPLSYAGGETTALSLGFNQNGWAVLPSPWWAAHVLLNQNVPGTGICRSFMIMSSVYARFLGTSNGPTCDLRVLCNWNFQTSAGTAPRWY